jgi:hypothetical protein
MIDILDDMPGPKPLIGLGGMAFNLDPALTNRIPGSFFGPRADEAARQIERVVDQLLKNA